MVLRIALSLVTLLALAACAPSSLINQDDTTTEASTIQGLEAPGDNSETDENQQSSDEATAPDWTQPLSPSDVNKCRILDGQSEAARAVHEGTQVGNVRARGNIGFPLSPTTLPISGESNFIAAMVSFDDAPPSNQTPASYLKPQLEKIVQWGDFWSQGKLTFNFQMVDEWINIPVKHEDYPVNRRLSFQERQGNSNEIIKLIAAELPPDLDYEGLDGVMVYWSPGVDYFEGDLGLQGFEGVALPFPTGAQEVFFWSGNEWWYRTEGKMTAEMKAEKTWSFWIYLMLDSMGLHNHGPGNGWPSGLQQTQTPKEGEFSGALLGWDEFKLGWSDDSQIHCMAPEDIEAPSQFILSAREVFGGEKRLAVIPFDELGALVIESRRPIGWSDSWSDEKSGLLVYFVDTELEIDRVDSHTQAGCGNPPEQPKWAYHLFKDGFSGDCRKFDNAFLRTGDELTFRDMQIRLVHSGETEDYVEVVRVN